MHTRTRVSALAAFAGAAAMVIAPAGAMAVPNYPEPTKPTGQTGKPRGPFKTLRVSKTRPGAFRKIQAAVNAAQPGDTVRVADGTYREGVKLSGTSKRYVKIIGNPKDPQKVLVDATGLKGGPAQNAFFINGADEVTLRGIKAKGQKANGFFVTNAKGYTFDRLVAERNGAYGLYAFNSRGGTMTNSLAYYQNDGGFYIGQTKEQPTPIRSIVRNVTAWGNVVGFTGTNMRYVTITKSRFFNNGLGVVPNALDSEKFPPEEDNVIRDNDIFWNNFNYFAAAPFKLRKGATGEVAYPVGTGLLLFGGRDQLVENNRIFGNYLMGAGAVQQILLKDKSAADLKGNVFRKNVFGKAGTDRNGRDMFYDGNGSGNCYEGNVGVQVTTPADGSTFAPCPFTGANTFSKSAQDEAVNWTVGDPTHEKNWVRNPHSALGDASIAPLERYAPGRFYGPRGL